MANYMTQPFLFNMLNDRFNLRYCCFKIFSGSSINGKTTE